MPSQIVPVINAPIAKPDKRLMGIFSVFFAPQHDLWKHFVDLAYWNVELSDQASAQGLPRLSRPAVALAKA